MNRNVGDLGPDFALYNQEDHVIILNRIVEHYKAVVVYFFPQAGAPGCVREATSFRDLMPEFQARGVRIIGITAGTQRDVAEMAKAHNLNFDICADPYRQICDEWGAIRGDNVARITFILNDRGRITHAFQRVDVWKHAQEVLALFPAPADAAAPAEAAPAQVAAPAAPVAHAPAPVAHAAAPVAHAAAPVAHAAAPVVHAAAPVAHAAAPTGDWIVQVSRSTLHLLLAHKLAGGAVPADVVEICAQLSGRSGQS